MSTRKYETENILASKKDATETVAAAEKYEAGEISDPEKYESGNKKKHVGVPELFAATDKHGFTPADMARLAGHDDLGKWLKALIM